MKLQSVADHARNVIEVADNQYQNAENVSFEDEELLLDGPNASIWVGRAQHCKQKTFLVKINNAKSICATELREAIKVYNQINYGIPCDEDGSEFVESETCHPRISQMNCETVVFEREILKNKEAYENQKSSVEEKTIFKYFRIDNLMHILQKKCLFIDKVKECWEDKYENFLLKENILVGGSPLQTDQIAEGIYGQSWTTLEESDAMWRIYSPDKRGVKIQTTTKKLFDAVYVNDACMSDTFLRCIKYKPQAEIDQWAKSLQGVSSQIQFQSKLTDSLFLKRDEFIHEKEYRIVKSLDSETVESISTAKRIAFRINVDDFIEKYVFDPRISDECYNCLSQELIRNGVNPTKISRSKLYDFDPITIQLEV